MTGEKKRTGRPIEYHDELHAYWRKKAFEAYWKKKSATREKPEETTMRH